MYMYNYMYMYICIYVYMYICIYVYMYICIYVYMYMYMHMYACMHLEARDGGQRLVSAVLRMGTQGAQSLSNIFSKGSA